MSYTNKIRTTADIRRHMRSTVVSLMLLATVGMSVQAADINSVEATYDLATEGLELVFDFADASDSTTPSGLKMMGIDFDLSGSDGPFRNEIQFQGPVGSTIRSYAPLGSGRDTLVVEFPEPLMGSQTFSLLFENIDTSSINRSSNRSVDLQLNRDSLLVTSSALRYNVPHGFQGQRFDNITNARVGFVSLSTIGDFDGNGVLDLDDLNLLSGEIHDGSASAQFDLDQSGVVDLGDRQYWVTDVKSTLIGDADLNGVVDFPDFLVLSKHFGSVAGEGTGLGWSEGDFDGDRSVGFPDFLALSENFGASAVAAAVPEPSASYLAMIGMLGIVGFRRRRR